MTAVNLKTHNAFGMISVDANLITCILSAVRANDDKPLHRTIKAESSHELPTGSALISISITETGHIVTAHELGEIAIVGHPDIDHVLDQAVEWILKSA